MNPVELWERGAGQHPVDRALTVLSMCSGKSWEECAHASVGARDTMLLQTYERLVGGNIDAYAECPACNERLEYSVRVSDLLSAGTGASEIEAAGVRMRLPNSLDLAAAAACADVD